MKKMVGVVVGVVLVLALLFWNRKLLSEGRIANVSSVELVAHDEIELTKTNVNESSVDISASEIETNKDRVISKEVLLLIHPDTGYKERLKAMKTLGYEIAPQDVDALMKFLRDPESKATDLGALSFNSIRNDALEILLRQKQMPEGIGELLTDVYGDSDHDGIWRNYCLQFMEPYYDRQAGVLGGTNSLSSVQESLWNALGERDNSNAGTALLAMDKLSRKHSEFKPEELSAAMIDLAQDAQASVANRVTALRLCGERGCIEVLEAARTLARQSDNIMLRCSAIATLGEIGTEDDFRMLKAYTRSRDKRIQQIAKVALAKRVTD